MVIIIVFINNDGKDKVLRKNKELKWNFYGIFRFRVPNFKLKKGCSRRQPIFEWGG